MNISNKKKMIVFWILTVNTMMVCLLQTALNTALSPIMEEMQISASTVQWLASGYSLTLGIVMLATAFLFRRFSTKPLTLIAIILSVSGCAVSAMAGTFGILLFGRILQAAGGGIILNMVSVVILSIFPDEKKGTMMGVYGLCTCVGPVFAPVIGGVIVDLFGWKVLFWIFTLIFTVILIVAIFGMESVLENEAVKFDGISMTLCSIGFCGLIIGIGNTGTASNLIVSVLIPMIIGAISITIFCIRQLKLQEPFMDLRVLKNKIFSLALINGVIMMLVMTAQVTMIPLCSQSVLGFSATQSGLIILPGSLIMGVINMLFGTVYDKIGIKIPLLLGGIFSLIGVGATACMNTSQGVVSVAIVYAMTLVGAGMLSSTVMTWGMSKLELHQISQASALFGSIRTIAGAFGSAIFVGIMTAVANYTGSMEEGMHFSFLLMFIPTGIQFVVCLMGIKSSK